MSLLSIFNPCYFEALAHASKQQSNLQIAVVLLEELSLGNNLNEFNRVWVLFEKKGNRLLRQPFECTRH